MCVCVCVGVGVCTCVGVEDWTCGCFVCVELVHVYFIQSPHHLDRTDARLIQGSSFIAISTSSSFDSVIIRYVSSYDTCYHSIYVPSFDTCYHSLFDSLCFIIRYLHHSIDVIIRYVLSLDTVYVLYHSIRVITRYVICDQET